MARDFDFKGVGQADFTNANQMVAQARMAWDNALKMAQDTLADTNKAVSNRNEALLQDYMNAIPQEQWGTAEANVAVDNAFEKVKELTGGMYDAKVMNTYRDNRGTELLQRQANDLTVKKQAQEWQIHYDDYIADGIAKEQPLLEAILTDPSKVDTPAYEKALIRNEEIAKIIGAKPHLASMIEDKITVNTTNKATAGEKLIQAQMLSDLPEINVLLSDLAQYEPLTRQPMPEGLSEDEQTLWKADQATAIAKVAQLNQALDPHIGKYGRGRINELYQGIMAKAQDAHNKNYGTPFERTKFKAQQDAQNRELLIKDMRLFLQGKLTDAQIDKIIADISVGQQNADTTTYKALNGGDGGSGGSGSSKEPAIKVASNFFQTNPVTADGTIKPQMSSVIFGTLDNIPDLIESGREKDFYVSSDDYDKFKLDSLAKLKTMYGDSGTFRTEYGFHTLAGHLDRYIKPAYTDTKRNVTVPARPLTNWEKKQILMSTATGNIKGWWLTNDNNYINHITKELALLDEKKYRATNEKQKAYLNNALQHLVAIGFDYGQIALQMNLSSKDAYYDKYPKALKDSIRAKEASTPPSPKDVLQSNVPYNQSVGALTGLTMPTAFRNPSKPKDKDKKGSGGRVPVN